jgi:hypothetical protein
MIPASQGSGYDGDGPPIEISHPQGLESHIEKNIGFTWPLISNKKD